MIYRNSALFIYRVWTAQVLNVTTCIISNQPRKLMKLLLTARNCLRQAFQFQAQHKRTFSNNPHRMTRTTCLKTWTVLKVVKLLIFPEQMIHKTITCNHPLTTISALEACLPLVQCWASKKPRTYQCQLSINYLTPR